jgi:hypothetical protein
MDADAANVRMKWILAIESTVLDIRHSEASASNRLLSKELSSRGRHSTNLEDMPTTPGEVVSLDSPKHLTRTGSDVTDYVSKMKHATGNRYVPLMAEYFNNVNSPSAAQAAKSPVSPSSTGTKSGDFQFRSLSSEDPPRHAGKSGGDVEGTTGNDRAGTHHDGSRRLAVSTEQQMLTLSESLLRAWMSDDIAGYHGIVAPNISATIFSSEFTLTADGREDVWDLKGNTFFNPLGNYCVSSAMAIRESRCTIRETHKVDNEEESWIHSVWCEVFVLPVGDSGLTVSTGPTGVGGPNSRTSGSTFVAGSSTHSSSAPAASQLVSVLPVAALEEYEVQIVFSPSLDRVCKMLFHRVDVCIRDEATFRIQQAITEAVMSLQRRIDYGTGSVDSGRRVSHAASVSDSDSEEELGASAVTGASDDQMFNDRSGGHNGTYISNDNGSSSPESGLSAALLSARKHDVDVWRNLVKLHELDHHKQKQIARMVGLLPRRTNEAGCHRASKLVETAAEIDIVSEHASALIEAVSTSSSSFYMSGTEKTKAPDKGINLPSKVCTNVIGKDEFDKAIIRLLTWSQAHNSFTETLAASDNVIDSAKQGRRALVNFALPEYISIPEYVFQSYSRSCVGLSATATPAGRSAFEELLGTYRMDDVVKLNVQFPTFGEGFRSVGINIDFPIHKTVTSLIFLMLV